MADGMTTGLASKVSVELEVKIKDLQQKIATVNSELEKVGQTASKAGAKMSDGIKTGVTKASKITNTFKKDLLRLSKVFLALFSLRTINLFLKRLIEVNINAEEFRAKLDSSLATLSNAFTPVLSFIVDLLSKALSFAAGMAYQFFYTEQAMAQYNADLAESIKRQKKLNAQLAGFDELNTLASTKDTSAPFTDMTESVKEGMQFWKDWGLILISIAAILATIKLADFINSLDVIGSLVKTFPGLFKLGGKGLSELGTLFEGLATVVMGPIDSIFANWPTEDLTVGGQLFFDFDNGGAITGIVNKNAILLGQLESIRAALESIGVAMGFSSGSAAAVFVGLTVVLAALTAAFLDLWNTSLPFREFFTWLGEMFVFIGGVLLAQFIGWIVLLSYQIGNLFSALYNLYEMTLKPIVDIFFRILGIGALLMGGIFGTAFSITLGIIGGALAIVIGLFQGLVAVLTYVFEEVAKGNPLMIILAGIIAGALISAITPAIVALWAMFGALVAVGLEVAKNAILWAIDTAQMLILKGVTVITTAAQWLLNAALTANPIGLVVMGVAALIAIFAILYKNVEPFRNFMDGLWKGILDGLNSVGKLFKDVFNGIAKVWNKTLGSWSIDIPKWVPLIGGMKFVLPKIPELAQGGMLNAGQAFIAGEAGAELIGSYNNKTTVMPLENTSFVKAMADAVYGAMTTALNEGGNSQVVLQVDGMTLAKATEANLNKLSTVQGGLKIAF